MKPTKLINIKKDDLSSNVVSRLRSILPKPEIDPRYLLVDDDVFESLSREIFPSAIQLNHINFIGWLVIGRSMVCEVG